MAPRRYGLTTSAVAASGNRSRYVLRVVNVLGIAACIVVSLLMLTMCGCRSGDVWRETAGNATCEVDRVSRKIDQPVAEVHQVAWSSAPTTIRHREDLENIKYRDLTLDETLQIALQNSDVLRELGGTVLRNPAAIHSRFTGSLAVTDPRFSPEAALSAFDTQLRASAFFSNNDQLYNNPFFAGGTNAFRQDLHEYEVELSKITATGSQLALRSMSLHNANNAPGNIFRSAWDTYLEGEIRKPLLQGGGLQFNRIAGPGSSPGAYNGVLLARVSADMDQTAFEAAVRNYVNDVTNAYWDLYFAYRDLDAKTRAMQRALEAWNRIRARAESDLESGAAEALAREQYFRFKSDVDEAITGRVSHGTRTGNGSTGGTLEGAGGVQTTERRLRLLIGLTITDGELIRPSSEPLEADVVFSWDIIQQDAMRLRPELRKQQMAVRRRELELMAARNFLNPRLDAVGRYRFRGFGDDLLRTDENGPLTSAVGNMVGGDQQEWFVGFEYEVPLGYRKAHLAVTNAELRLSRERIIQREQQREVVHNLTNAVADSARAYQACQNSLNRYLAAQELLTAYEVQDEQDMDIDVDHLLDAQRRVVESEIRYYRARTEYAVALKNVHLEKGSLLTYHNLHIFDHPQVVAETDPDPDLDPDNSGRATSEPDQLLPASGIVEVSDAVPANEDRRSIRQASGAGPGPGPGPGAGAGAGAGPIDGRGTGAGRGDGELPVMPWDL
ncbi:MAG: TolC family protein [Fuerstiella sp.]